MIYKYSNNTTFTNKDIIPIFNAFISQLDLIPQKHQAEAMSIAKMMRSYFIDEQKIYCDTSNYQIFYESIFFEALEFRIHFNVSVLEEELKNISEAPETLECSNFSNITGGCYRIKYSITTLSNEDMHLYANLQEPIILVPFPNGDTNYLVVDGNHRVTARKATHKTINSYCVDPLAIENAFFSNAEKCFYYLLVRLKEIIPPRTNQNSI